MPVTRVDPKQASELLGQGWTYLDVRSIPEYEQGHPPGAYNIPLLHFEEGRGMLPNPDFLAVVQAVFAPDRQLVVACRAGRRSLRAAELLADAGYTAIVDMRGGYAGERDLAGGGYTPGWTENQLPVTQQAEPGRTYDELAARRG